MVRNWGISFQYTHSFSQVTECFLRMNIIYSNYQAIGDKSKFALRQKIGNYFKLKEESPGPPGKAPQRRI